MADNTVVIALKVDNGALSTSLNQSKDKFKGFKSQLKREFSGIGRAFKTALSFGGVGGVAGIAVAGKQVLDFQRQLLTLATRAKLSKEEIAGLEKQVFRVGEATAQQPEDLLAGAQAYQELTGKARDFIANLEVVGRVSTATGASMADLARTQAALSQNLGISGEEMGLAFDIMARGADAGAIEFKDFATLTQDLTAQFKLFNKSGVEGLNELQAMLQITRRGFGGASEAATGLGGMMTAILRNADKFKKIGVNVFETGPGGKKQLRSLMDIVKAIDKAGVSQTKLVKTFGRVEGFKAFLTLTDPQNAKDYESIANAQEAVGYVTKDFNRIIDSTPAKVDRAKVRLKEAFNKALADNIDGIAKAMNGIADAISWIADNPKTAIAIAAMGKLASIFLRSGGFGSGGMLGNAMGGGGGIFAGNPDIGKGKGKVGKLGAAGAALPAFGTGYAIGKSADELLNAYGVGSESLRPIEERETEAEMYARKARELRETVRSRTELVEKSRTRRGIEFGALLGGQLPGGLKRRERVKVGDDFDVAKAEKEIAYYERQARALSNPGQLAQPQQVDVNIKVQADQGTTATTDVRRRK